MASTVLLPLDPASSSITAPLAQPEAPLPPSEPPPTAHCTTFDNNLDAESMTNPPVRVEDVSLDEDSIDDLMSLASESSAGSYDDGLKAIYDDHE